MRALLLVFWLATALFSRAAVISESFDTAPSQGAWRTFGDSSLFYWNATNHNLEVTWDSSHSNSFFYHSLGTILTTNDDFSFSFDLRLLDIHAGSTPGKTNEFEIAIGLINFHNATNSNAYRGAGVSRTYGVRNIVEFDYFPDAGFGDTFATTVISSNNAFAYYNNFPRTISTGVTYRITMSYTASNQLLRTSATTNGVPFSPLEAVSLTGKPDFRVDSFAITSYSDAVQVGSPNYYGSVLAHGAVDNTQMVLPSTPLSQLQLRRTNLVWRAGFISTTNWLYTLEGSADSSAWTAVSASVNGTGGMLWLGDTNVSGTKSLYRVKAERP